MFRPAYNSKKKVVLASEEEKNTDTYECIECGKVMILRKGKTNAAHFAHKGQSNCNPKPESLEHKAAKIKLKEILEEGSVIIISLGCMGQHKMEDQKLCLEKDDETFVEKSFLFEEKNIRPDLSIVDSEGKLKVALEIFFTHR